MKKFKKLLGLVLSATMCCSTLFACSTGTTEQQQNSQLNATTTSTTEYQLLKKTTVRDKILGSWIGQAIGLGSGFEYVHGKNSVNTPTDTPIYLDAYYAIHDKYWEPGGIICGGNIGTNPYKIGPFSHSRVGRGIVHTDDDMHVDILNQFIMRDNGAHFGAWQISSSWQKYGVSDVGGGETVTQRVINDKCFLPYVGQNAFGCNGWWVTEPWIENETLGITFPYMPQSLEAYSKLFTTMQGDGYSVYLGNLCALMQSLVYEESNVLTILQKAFNRMDKNNAIYKVYQYVLQEYKNNTPWRTVAVEIINKFTEIGMVHGVSADKPAFSITANAGMIFLGLIYGENDFEKTVKITSLAGLDGDCTGSTVGALLGSIYGYNQLPQKYKDYLNGNSIYVNYTGKNGDIVQETFEGAFAYCGKNFPDILTFNQITDITIQNIETQIVANGGQVLQDEYIIVTQQLDAIGQVQITNPHFEQGLKGWDYASNGSTVSITTEKLCYGNYGVQIQNAKNDTSVLSQVVQLIPNKTYRLSVYANANGGQLKLFAENKNRSFICEEKRTFVKYDMVFTAETLNNKIGITYNATENNTLYVSDVFIEDITHLTPNSYVVYSANNGLDIIKQKNKTICTLNFNGIKGYQTAKIYCKVNTNKISKLSIAIDGNKQGDLPMFAQGENTDFNQANCYLVDIYACQGAHTLQLTYNGNEDIIFDRVELAFGNAIFKR